VSADTTAGRRLPPAASVLRRALFAWGLGHLAVGDARGWALLILQPLIVGGLAAAMALALEGSRWIALFPALALVLLIWLGQAMHAHRLAVERGAEPGGEMQIALAMPLVVLALSGFWLIGGTRSSPAATVQHYVAAWQSGKPTDAARMFSAPAEQAQLIGQWTAHRSRVERVVAEGALVYGAQSGLDTARPFNSLRFEQASTSAGRAVIRVDIVRRQRVETMLFGLIPTATQQTVLVEHLGEISLRAQPVAAPDWLPFNISAGQRWLIERVDLAADPS
jgi:hypothetical protein